MPDYAMNATDLVAAYQTPRGDIRAVDYVSFSLPTTGIVGIAGESGCGKTTLIRVLYGLIEPPLKIVSGDVKVKTDGHNNLDLLKLSEEEVRKLRWKFFSYIPQASMGVLNPVMRIEEQFFDVMGRSTETSKPALRKQLSAYLDEFGLPNEVLRSFPHQLSGGMRQRVVIAIATILHPAIVFADEPTTALDVVVQRGVLQLIKDAQRSLENLVVIVTHDMGVHYQTADMLIIMYAGKVVEIGGTDETFEDPLHPYTKLLIDSLPKIGDKLRRKGISGSPPSFLNLPQGCRFHPRCPYAMPVCRKEEPHSIETKNRRSVACHLIG